MTSTDELIQRLQESAKDFELPPSIQSQRNIRAINAMHDAVKEINRLREILKRLSRLEAAE